MTLVNAVSDRRTGEMSAEVYIADKINPTSGTVTSDYAEILQEHLERPIMSDADALGAQFKLQRDADDLIRTMV
jgi:hypothetical protein